jgi:hypothetical protein
MDRTFSFNSTATPSFSENPIFERGEAGAAASPVDVTGMCSAGPDDPYDAIWQRMAKLCRVDLDAMPMLQTTVDKRRVRANYNAGLLFGPSKLYPLVAEFLVNILRDEIKPYPTLKGGIKSGAGPVSPEGSQFWGTSQAAISLALAAMNMPIRILGQDHNVPVHMLDEFSEPLLRVTHLHYHSTGCSPRTASIGCFNIPTSALRPINEIGSSARSIGYERLTSRCVRRSEDKMKRNSMSSFLVVRIPEKATTLSGA